MKFLASIALALTIGCTDQRALDTSETVVIRNDGGGQLISAEADRLKLLKSGVDVEIRGYCASACVMFTTLPNACLGTKSRIGFHSGSIDIPFLVGDAQMSRYLRNGVRSEYNRTWSKSQEMHWITAQEYVALDPEAKLCSKG